MAGIDAGSIPIARSIFFLPEDPPTCGLRKISTAPDLGKIP